jgi:thioredoxin-disulfide reductase
MSPDVRNVIIIGSGPAGYTAAIYAARANLHPLVFEGSVSAGGALMNTTDVENFPGFPDGIMGPALMDDLRKQAEKFGAELVSDDVTDVDLTGDVKQVLDTAGDAYCAKAVILAMGSGYRKLGVTGEDHLSGHGVSWCATCDGFFFREQDIVVVGGGDSAVEEATFLTRFARKVTLVHRRDKLRASKIMAARAEANDKIEFAWNSEVAEIVGDSHLEAVVLRDTVTGNGSVHRDRSRSSLGARQRSGRPRRGGLCGRRATVHPDQPSRCLRRRRPRRPHVPSGGDRRRYRLCGRTRRGALSHRSRGRVSREFPFRATTLDTPGADVTFHITINETRRIHE